jgi:hypothetical protein
LVIMYSMVGSKIGIYSKCRLGDILDRWVH